MTTELLANPVPGIDPKGDPATPENRRLLARRLLAGAIRRYEEVSLEWSAVHESFPHLDPPRHPSSPVEFAEWDRWRELLSHANENFNNAEMNLAERIQGLFDMLSPPGRRAGESPTEYFVPRAVRSGGFLYVLSYSAWQYEPNTNAIAVYSETMVFDLADVESGPSAGAIVDET
jgi:hypothetical protein